MRPAKQSVEVQTVSRHKGRRESFCLPLSSIITQVISGLTLKRNLTLRGVDRYAGEG